MSLVQNDYRLLEDKAYELRNLCVDTVVWAGSGHIGGALSAMDILTILYYKHMKLDSEKPNWEDRDRFILSKGHIGVGFAPVLADKGFFSKEELKSYNHFGSNFGMHLDANKVNGLDASTGSLGHGLPLALGMVLAGRINSKNYHVYCLLGDGECDEGSVWESAMAISHYNATRLITIIDRNRLMMDGETKDVMDLEPFADKWKAFGFHVIKVDGHNFQEMDTALNFAKNYEDKPVVIIAETIKGCGIDFMENNYKWHYGGLDSLSIEASKASLKKSYEQRLEAL